MRGCHRIEAALAPGVLSRASLWRVRHIRKVWGIRIDVWCTAETKRKPLHGNRNVRWLGSSLHGPTAGLWPDNG